MNRALVMCGDTWHPAETIQRGLGALGDCGFRFEFLTDGAAWPVAQMNEFSLIVLAKANIMSATVSTPWLTPASQMVFTDYVSRGGGLLVVHAGTSRYEKLPAMKALVGGAFERHPDQCAVTIEPSSRHPITVGVVPFTVPDEHYFVTISDPTVDLFLHSHSEHGVQPAGWTRTQGGGRVGVLTPGHNLDVWQHPMYQKLLFNALRWTAKSN